MPRKLTERQVENILRLHATTEMTQAEIAEYFGITQAGVSRVAQREGIKWQRRAPRIGRRGAPQLTEGEKKVMRELDARGVSQQKIAEYTGRSQGAVSNVLNGK